MVFFLDCWILMVKFDWKLTLHFLWKKVGTNSRFYQGERNRQTRYRISRLSCIKHIKKITFTELGSFESQVLLNVELPESITDCCHTLDMTSLDKIITLSVCYVSAILGSKTVTQYYWTFFFKSVCMVHPTTSELDHFVYNSGKGLLA